MLLCSLTFLLPNAAFESPLASPSPLSGSPHIVAVLWTKLLAVILFKFVRKNLLSPTRSKLSKKVQVRWEWGVAF